MRSDVTLGKMIVPVLKMPFCNGITPQLTRIVIAEALKTVHCLAKGCQFQFFLTQNHD